MKVQYLIAILLLSFCSVKGQPMNTDSLWREFHNEQNTIDGRVITIRSIIIAYESIDPDSAMISTNIFIDFALQHNDPVHISTAYRNKGINFALMAAWDSAEHYLQNATDIALRENDNGLAVLSLEPLGSVQINMGKDAMAIANLEKALPLAEIEKDTLTMLYIEMSIANLLQDYDRPKAMEYSKEAYKLAMEISDYELVGQALSLIVAIHGHDHQWDSVRIWNKLQLENALTNDIPFLEVEGYYTLGEMYQNTGRSDSAIYYYDKSIRILENAGVLIYRDNLLLYNWLSKGIAFHSLGSYAEGLAFCQKAYEAAEAMGNRNVTLSVCECLSDNYYALGRYEEASKYLIEARELQKDITETENIQKILRSEMKIEFQQQQLQDSIVAAEKRVELQAEIKNKQKTNNTILLSSLTGGLMLLGFLLFALNRNRTINAQKEVIEEQQSLLQKDYLQLKEFTENASHEMQTPMAIIHGKLESLMQTENISEEQMRHVQNIYTATYRMSVMNRSLLLLAKIENNQFDDRKEINISDEVKEMLSEFEELFADKNLQVKSNITPGIVKSANEFLTSTIFYNLLKNAVSHNIQQGDIEISLTEEGLKITNTGNELRVDPKELFDRFKKASGSEESTGLGLAIVKKSCEAQHWLIDYVYADKRHELSVKF